MTPFSFTDTNLNTVAFDAGVISTVGPVELDRAATIGLVSKLLQHATQKMVDE